MNERRLAAHIDLFFAAHAYPSRLITRFLQSRLLCWLLVFLFVLALLPIARPTATLAAPQLWLPTPIGEPWKIIQGYGCGTHNSYDFFALDLVRANGPIYGAPVHAAAEGTVFGWFGSSGTLIIKHTDTFYTQYTHLASVTKAGRGQFIARGEVVGTVGDRGTAGNPHLHFMAFTAHGAYASGRQTVPLFFADGYALPDIGGCNQHYGKILIGKAPADLPPPEVHFVSDADPKRWYNEDKRIDFTIEGPVKGFSQAWEEELLGDGPMYEYATEGYVQIAWAEEGMHTLYVRAYGVNGDEVLATYGPIGYDVTPPQAPKAITTTVIRANTPSTVQWNAAHDKGAGIAGYRVYIGAEADGESEWFTEEPQVETPALDPGTYFLRVQALDLAGNVGEWKTIGQVVVSRDELPEAAEATPTATVTPSPEATPSPTKTPAPTDTPEATSPPTRTPAPTDTPEATSPPTKTATQAGTPAATATATVPPPPRVAPSPTATATGGAGE